MRTGLIVFGILFLVVGVLLYLVPGQEFKANTTTVGDGSVDARTSSASVIVPAGWSYALGIIGLLLLLIGLLTPDARVLVKEVPESDSYVVQTKEHIETGRGKNRKIVKERVERRVKS